MSVTIIVIVMCDITVQYQNKPGTRAFQELFQAFLMHQNLPLISETFYYVVIGGNHPGVTVIRQVLSSHVLSSSCSLSPFHLQSIFFPVEKDNHRGPLPSNVILRRKWRPLPTSILIDQHIGIDLDLEPAQQACLIWRCEAIRHYSASSILKGPYYPVVYTGLGGTKAMIYRDWQ